MTTQCPECGSVISDRFPIHTCEMTPNKALEILGTVKARLGRNYKAAIRDAWMSGNYHGCGLDEWSSQLQTIRNRLGPTWLVNAKP